MTVSWAELQNWKWLVCEVDPSKEGSGGLRQPVSEVLQNAGSDVECLVYVGCEGFVSCVLRGKNDFKILTCGYESICVMFFIS